jgi:hypothetical protein
MILTFPGQACDATDAELIAITPDQIAQGQTPSILTYRGHQYEVNPTEIALVASERSGMYRGVGFKSLNIPALPNLSTPMTYRGIRYNR